MGFAGWAAIMLLEVRDLKIRFNSRHSNIEAVKGISFSLDRGKTLAIVGESGSGKSVTSMSLSRLLPPPPKCEVAGQALLDGENLLEMSERRLRSVRGKRIAYVFQEPSTSLNPYFTVGAQIEEALKFHRSDVQDFKQESIGLLEKVGIRDASSRYGNYPHQMSGGMKQRVVIAMALACQPDILVADEPTTALDVTIEAQIMDLLRELRDKEDMAIILITHNFGIVDGFADEVAVMYQGKIVEQGETTQVLASPKHEYTKALIRCIPRLGVRQERLPVVDYAAIAEKEASHV
ncbi:ABC transporter ATP-binding protein [Pelagicoccus enzymogenes]|nr:ABC transporter ATP-binding protein [Pelagicoccus enzymogenes]MDQ8197151.1 ABC transporter ATP-binding protein [Pelagicoccus enzymogenes]